MLFAALFFVLLVVRLWRLAARSPVSVAWWTYTFPSAALATALVRYQQQVLGLSLRCSPGAPSAWLRSWSHS